MTDYHDAYPALRYGEWLGVCETCNVAGGPYKSRADATLAAALHIRGRRGPGERMPEPRAKAASG